MGEKIGARLRLISLSLSIGWNTPPFSRRELYALENRKKKSPNSITGSDNGERKISKNLITCDIDKMRVVRFLIFYPSPEKMTFTLVFWQGFGGPDGINYVAKTASVAGPLAGIGRGENLPYFGKQSDY